MAGERPYRVLVAGAGVAGLEVLLALRRLAEDRVELEVLEPAGEFVHRPLAVAEPFGAGEVFRYSLDDLLAPHGVAHRRDALASVEPGERRVTTVRGDVVAYRALVVACGARPVEALPGSLAFHGPESRDGLHAILDDLAAGRARSVVFALPGGVVWPLPLYELALMAAAHLRERPVEVTLVTPEPEPLAVFGGAAAEAVAALLAERGIAVLAGRYPVAVEDGELVLAPDGRLQADRVVSLPRLEGPRVPGLPHDAGGFLPTNDRGEVRGVPGVYAAGDAVAFPIKQGGIAAQQADAVAELLAARVGAPVTPRPFRPVLRGLLLTGGAPEFLRAEVTSGHGETSAAAAEPLWWPPGKVAGRYLAPALAALAGVRVEPPAAPGALPVEVELEPPGGRGR